MWPSIPEPRRCLREVNEPTRHDKLGQGWTRGAPPPKRWRMKARVTITLKPGVLDPQGRAIQNALGGLGFAGVSGVRQGKVIELDLADGTSEATIADIATKLLANTVIENYRIEIL